MYYSVIKIRITFDFNQDMKQGLKWTYKIITQYVNDELNNVYYNVFYMLVLNAKVLYKTEDTGLCEDFLNW